MAANIEGAPDEQTQATVGFHVILIVSVAFAARLACGGVFMF